MHVYERQPLCRQLWSLRPSPARHQDAIAKGMTLAEGKAAPPVDLSPICPSIPSDIGRTYDADVIRINSQSGKGGIGLPAGSRTTATTRRRKCGRHLGYRVKDVSDHEHRELMRRRSAGRLREQLPQRHTHPLNASEAATLPRTQTAAFTAMLIVVHQRRQHDPVHAPPATAAWTLSATPSEQQYRACSFTLMHLQRARPRPGYELRRLLLRRPEVGLTGDGEHWGCRHAHGYHRGGHSGAGQLDQQ